MERFLLVCLGGALGSGARYLVSVALLAALGPAFPFGTLTVNLVGSFLLAVVVQVAASTTLSANAYLLLTTGLMGGFTTYSTFNYETFRLFQDGEWVTGAVYFAATVAGCLVACALGLASGRALAGV